MTISEKRKFPRESMQISPFFQRIHGDFTIFPRRIDLKIEGKPESNLSFDYEKKHLAGVSISCLFCRKILSKWYRDVTCLPSLLLMPYCIFLREVTPKCVGFNLQFPPFFPNKPSAPWKAPRHGPRQIFCGCKKAQIVVVSRGFGWVVHHSKPRFATSPVDGVSFPTSNLGLFQLVQLVQLVSLGSQKFMNPRISKFIRSQLQWTLPGYRFSVGTGSYNHPTDGWTGVGKPQVWGDFYWT